MTKNRTEPCLFVVFGATGDLNRRKLLPALYELSRRNFLTNSQILGVSRSTEMNDAAFRARAQDVVKSIKDEPDGSGSWCDQCLHYRSIGEGTEADYQRL